MQRGGPTAAACDLGNSGPVCQGRPHPSPDPTHHAGLARELGAHALRGSWWRVRVRGVQREKFQNLTGEMVNSFGHTKVNARG